MPGLRVQIPRTIKSIRTPLAEASYNLAMTFLSSNEFIFAIIYASSPRLAPLNLRERIMDLIDEEIQGLFYSQDI